MQAVASRRRNQRAIHNRPRHATPRVRRWQHSEVAATRVPTVCSPSRRMRPKPPIGRILARSSPRATRCKGIAIRKARSVNTKKHALTSGFVSFPHPCGGNRIADATVPFPPFVGCTPKGNGAADPVHRPFPSGFGHPKSPVFFTFSTPVDRSVDEWWA